MTALNAAPADLHLVLSGSGLLGGRVAALLRARGLRVRAVSRSTAPGFDWTRPESWDAALQGVSRVYLCYAPDLAVPGAADAVAAFLERARAAGVSRIVLLSGRGEPEAQRAEAIVRDFGIPWTSVRASWFMQNFSEGAFGDMVRGGALALPVGAVKEPFVDIRDIAEVAAAAMAEDGHEGRIYDVTGPELLSFAEAMKVISAAMGRETPYVTIPREDFATGARAEGVPEEIIWLIDYLTAEVLDGRNAHLGHGVEEALGRKPRGLREFAAEEAAKGLWPLAA